MIIWNICGSLFGVHVIGKHFFHWLAFPQFAEWRKRFLLIGERLGRKLVRDGPTFTFDTLGLWGLQVTISYDVCIFD